jgi:hypothetical protein
MRLALAALQVLVLAAFGGNARAAPAQNGIGVAAHIPDGAVLDLVAELGSVWVRLDNNWLQQEDPCSESVRFFDPLDDTVRGARDRGLCVFMTLAYTPPCASTGGTDGTSLNDVPDRARWASFVRQAVAHYRALGVRHFGLWNEANVRGFFEGTAAQYAQEVVLPGIPAVRAGCTQAGENDCLVLGPDLAHVGDYDVFLEAVLDTLRSAGASFDILTHHIYQSFDTQIWEGDSFVNALDQRRFPLTRRSLLDVLRDTGLAPGGVPAVEVWITETGYRARPPTDPGEMEDQRRHVMGALDQQLSRSWYTNTFFYEIVDSGDEIDGFGIARREGGGFFRKPGFAALRDRMAATPELSTLRCEIPRPQCSDGLDNDGDGRMDLADPGCAIAGDGDESDDPPRRRYDAPRSAPPAIDGSLADWRGADFVTLEAPSDWVGLGSGPPGAGDITARFAVRWDTAALYLAVAVGDDVHRNDHGEEELWRGDSLQVALDMGRNGGAAYDDTDDFEMGFALSRAGLTSHRWHSPAGAPAFTSDFAIVRSGSETFYEIRLPAESLGQRAFSEVLAIGFSLVVNEDDGAGRDGFLEWTPGIGTSKRPALFGELRLVAGPDGGGAPHDGGVPPDAGVPGPDAGAPGPDAGTGRRDGGPGERDGGPGEVRGAAGAGGCSAARGALAGPMAMVLVAAVLWTRRRRSA